MSKNFKRVAVVAAAYLGVVFLHLWLNVGLEHLGLFRSSNAETASFRVGFLPVT